MSRRKRARGIREQAPEIDQALPPERPKHGVAPVAAICALLVVVIFMAFWGLLSNAFVNYDDNVYVTENARVQRGITFDNVRWAFTTTYFGFYYPVTWLSHMLDCQLYGLDAGKHHLTSLVIHAMNAMLLLLLLLRMTGALWRCALVAGLFAIHPLHVESVAWIAERKDVLSTLFWLLTVLAWLAYVKKGSWRWYAVTLALFALGLMAKPMIVTLPFVLLLFDYWPLGRIQIADGPWPVVPGKLLAEKAPLFVMSAVSCVVTVVAQRSLGAVQELEVFPLAQRSANAALSYVFYVKKMLWPEPLAVLYPHPHASLLAWSSGGSVLLLAVLTGLALVLAKRAPYVAVGWFWYVGALVPVIGLVQVGVQARADRYTYVPLTGLFIVIAWGLAQLCGASAAARWVASGTLSVCLAALLVLARIQVGYWADSETLLRHTLAVTSGNYVAHTSLGSVLMEEGNLPEAIGHLREAVRIAPRYALGLNELGIALARTGHTDEAIERFQQALQVFPDFVDAQNNAGIALAAAGKNKAAIEHYEKALELNPQYGDAHYNLAILLARMGRDDEAVEQYSEALRISPDNPNFLDNLGLLLMKMGRLSEAIERLRQAVKVSPDFADARNNLGIALRKDGRNAEAIPQFQEALKSHPDFALAHLNLGNALATEGRYSEALNHYQEALRIDPQLDLARENLEGIQRFLRDQRGHEAP